MILNLQSPLKKIIQPEISEFVSKLTISRIIDYPEEKCVKCFFKELLYPVVLWEEDEYDLIGQWTDSDVIQKLNQIYNISQTNNQISGTSSNIQDEISGTSSTDEQTI